LKGLKQVKKKTGTQKKENERKTKNNDVIKLNLNGTVKA
jgi:hypothetical protein